MRTATMILIKDENELTCPSTPTGAFRLSATSIKIRLNTTSGGPPVAVDTPNA
jgi:hypothetical protein